MILDEQLKWDNHNEHQCKKISSNIALFRRAKQFVPQETLVTMYNDWYCPISISIARQFGKMVIVNAISINHLNYKRVQRE